MNRRKFLQALSAFGVAGTLPMTLGAPAWAATTASTQRLFITINAAGGWDPTALIDPKGNASRADGLGPVNKYAASAIKSAGRLQYAGYPDGIEPPASTSAGHLETFFNKHYQRLRVVNGIDTQTNGHVVLYGDQAVVAPGPIDCSAHWYVGGEYPGTGMEPLEGR